MTGEGLANEASACNPAFDETLAQTIDALANSGFAVVENVFPDAFVSGLVGEFEELHLRGLFRLAAIGANGSTEHRADIRRDTTMWFDEAALLPNQQQLWNCLETLKEEVNRSLFLGLRELEGHFSYYQPDAFYAKHIDRFRNDDTRVISCILYLNSEWQPGDGGELKIYTGPNESDFRLIEPHAGTLVCFMSAIIAHEVLKTSVPRLSFAGWFRRRALST